MSDLLKIGLYKQKHNNYSASLAISSINETAMKQKLIAILKQLHKNIKKLQNEQK